MTSLYDQITDRIVEKLKQGIVPWKRPWRTSVPENFVSGRSYSGINTMLLGMQGYGCPVWATFRQIQEAGGMVQKGSKGTAIVYASAYGKVDENDDDAAQKVRRVRFLKHYVVFNLEQTSGIALPESEAPTFREINNCEALFAPMPSKPRITHDGGNRAYYALSTDEIHMPVRDRFDSSEHYYGTLYHELVHSTGHSSRLDRQPFSVRSVGKREYSKEELVAEMGSSFLCAMCGIDNVTIPNSAAYIASWLTVLQNDTRLLVSAASQAQRAADYIAGLYRESP